jgi:flagellar biosynthetic protein FliQ
MSEDYVLQVLRQGLYLVLLVSGPAILVSLVVGLFISLIQATTQLQDHTLSFVPKLIAVLAVLAAAGAWMGGAAFKVCPVAFRCHSANPLIAGRCRPV